VTSDKDRVERDWLLERLAALNPTPPSAASERTQVGLYRDSGGSADRLSLFMISSAAMFRNIVTLELST
jgi:hypothetical protein